MSKIKLVLLFTNRKVIAFDEKGEQVPEITRAMTTFSEPSMVKYKEFVDMYNTLWPERKEALRRIADDNAETDIVRHRCWRHPITMAEFCSLLGHGTWYMRNYPERWRKETEID